jgi:hypothetical protein
MVLGLALIVSGAIVLYALRRALWRRLDDEEPEAPPVEGVHYAGPDDDPIDIPLDDGDAGEYGARSIYVPAERGTIYVSRTSPRPD